MELEKYITQCIMQIHEAVEEANKELCLDKLDAKVDFPQYIDMDLSIAPLRFYHEGKILTEIHVVDHPDASRIKLKIPLI